MNSQLRQDALTIIRESIQAVLPDEAVKKALTGVTFPGRVILIAAGKAAWQMADAAYRCMNGAIDTGVVLTKYHHVKGPIGKLVCLEAGHPVPDENSFAGTKAALKAVSGLTSQDTVLFLLSGGGSALFELPLIDPRELQDITRQLLACGADIVQINTIRKRLSAVKGGRFAQACLPAKVFSIVLSDILGDPLDMIASGPACADPSTCCQALDIAENYRLQLSQRARQLLSEETPKALSNVTTHITGSVRELCSAAEASCRRLGYTPIRLTDRLCCQAKEAGSFLGAIVKTHSSEKRIAFIAGGETVVQLTGKGLGGRNQELALSAALQIDGIKNAAVFSVGSDGTDGPTDAAGGYCDGNTVHVLREQGILIPQVLADNDAYHALQRCDGLIFTGPTGTNVNDLSVALLGD